MKQLMGSILLCLTSLTASAGITRTEHGYERVLGGIELNNACVTPTHVQTIKGLKVCIEKKEVLDPEQASPMDYICTKWATEIISNPRSYEVEKCIRFKNSPDGYPECAKTVIQKMMMPKTITIRTWTENGDYNDYPGRASKFTFPDCK